MATQIIRLTVNGRAVEGLVEPRRLLADATKLAQLRQGLSVPRARLHRQLVLVRLVRHHHA